MECVGTINNERKQGFCSGARRINELTNKEKGVPRLYERAVSSELEGGR